MTADALARAAVFLAVAATLLAAETWRPARAPVEPRRRRWTVNIALFLLGALALRLLAPGAAVGAALLAEGAGVGLLRWAGAPPVLALVSALVLMDLALYAQHRALHDMPFLWRLHAPHHADPELDTTTGVRFHPLEAVASAGWKALAAALMGAPVAAVVVYEIALNAFSLFAHANIRLPEAVERPLRTLIVTPSLHRLHHDRALGRHGPNFAATTVLWDRLFATYRTGPEPGALGLAETDGWGLRRVLLAPFAHSPR